MEANEITTTPEPVEPQEPATKGAPDGAGFPTAEQLEPQPEVDGAPVAAEPAGDAPLGEAGAKALERERQARKDAEREGRELKERVRELEIADARREVAAELRMTPAQAALLTGEDGDAMRAHGQALLDAFAPPTSPRARPREAGSIHPLKSGIGNIGEVQSAAAVADAVLRD